MNQTGFQYKEKRKRESAKTSLMQHTNVTRVATSSPKKHAKRIRLGRNLHLVGVNDDENNNNKNNIDLANFSSDDEEVYNSSMMSPIRIDETLDATKHGEDVDEVKKVEDNDLSSMKHADIDNSILMEDVGNDTVTSLQSTPSEAETTIQRVKEFIESKRKGLNEKKKRIKSKTKLDTPDPKPLPTITKTPVNNAAVNATTSSNNKWKKQLDVHQKKLRRLIHKIHKQPYEEEWSIIEWKLFQQYLNEWKLSEDDKMFQPIVLQDLFNCFIDELELRVHSLRKFKKWKEDVKKNGK